MTGRALPPLIAAEIAAFQNGDGPYRSISSRGMPLALQEKLLEWAVRRLAYDDAAFDEAARMRGETLGLPRVFTPAIEDGTPNMGVVEECAALDHSDTDNGRRLISHFGSNLVVVAQEKAKEPFYAVWAGNHWDVASGRLKAEALAQRIGDLVGLEAQYLQPDENERKAIEAGRKSEKVPEPDRKESDRERIATATALRLALEKRRKRRHDHAVSSKNVARIRAMLACAAPHIVRRPDDFNANPRRVAVQNATITFAPVIEKRINPRYLSAEETPNVPAEINVCTESRLIVKQGHRREDLITHVIPIAYDPNATAPRWLHFLNTMLPDDDVRRLVQVSSGLGLVGLTVQYLFFHYGDGANGKSVYMETLCRLLGDVAVTLPSTSLIGESGSSGGASPDLARLYGRRLLRVKELPEGEDLKEALVKELTGGETVTARDLFAGYMDFKPLFVGMMSGNGYPRITGIDDGIWRRMAVIHWPVKVPEAERREFEEMLNSFVPEYAGILNWLIEGVHIFQREGLVLPAAVRKATQDYRDDMDRTAAFVARCVVKDDTASPLQAKELYHAYCNFSADEGGKPMNNTAFGRVMGRKFTKDTTGRVVLYRGIRLINVPLGDDPYGGRFDSDFDPESFER
ncbi:phage/plasmid primase, P4 family [Rhizobium sp. LjRoot30]|uniref:DNA primase family protein n=1 Tax=Rhizobium sp. LjRoot30 TaxID=3342320 RepID=UPI003ECCF6F2